MLTQLYNAFDKELDRRNTESLKWDMRAHFGNAEALPMWVADMDFATAPCVIEGLVNRTLHGAFGYSIGEERDEQALKNWMKNRHALDIAEDDIVFCPGVVDAIYHTLVAMLNKGDKVAFQVPAYGPFRFMTEKAEMICVENPLVCEDGYWRMDLENLEEAFKGGVKAFILCSPQNPVGRIWKRCELEQVTALCKKYNVLLVCDEIHSDFELDGNRHTCILDVKDSENAVQLVSATKSFNLAALRHSALICRNAEIREKIAARFKEVMCDVNLYGRLATRYAYEGGAEWMTALNLYLTDSRNALERAIRDTGVLIPSRVEGTYLMWVDCRALKLDNKELMELFVKKVGIIPTEGVFFGDVGNGFVRFNMATRHANIDEAASRIRRAFIK